MKCFKAVTIILLISWMILIFSLSAETATESSQTSGGTISLILEIIYPKFSELSIENRQELIAPFQFIVRKSAHFLIYVVLGFLSFLAVAPYEKMLLKYKHLSSGLICLLYAVSDEIHQLFVVGRSCELRDMFIDFSGAVLGISICWLLLRSKIFKKIFKRVIL